MSDFTINKNSISFSALFSVEMKIHNIVFANARAPQNPNKVPFRELVQLQLKDKVDFKTETSSTGICLHEMTLVFSCFKRNNFNENYCQEELQRFQTCFDSAKGLKGGENSHSTKKISNLEVNKLLKRFPNK